MSLAFIHRNPSENETELYKLAFSVFRDGFGQEKEKDGSTRPGWREYERAVAEVIGGACAESKAIFDVLVKDDQNNLITYGISVKSKQLPGRNAMRLLNESGRVHMELSNSPAKFWAILNQVNLVEDDFRAMRNPELFGTTVLNTVAGWHTNTKNEFEANNRGNSLNLEESIYLTVSYSELIDNAPRVYQIHSFPLSFPEGIRWQFISEKCLRGYDPEFPEEALFDWYGFSGGQLKYYPKASNAIFSSSQFTLNNPPQHTILSRIREYWPDRADHLLP
ncbi:MAG: hypothetical protein LBG64_00635 [Pseudomonadales bacterium]|jgi:hypothetical protein|nr:hypothetical protein [Pseudomonadales bacterium]